MKKTFRFLGTILMAAVVAFTMTACGDDNDDASSNPPSIAGTSLTINATNFTVNRAYWTSEVLNENEKWFTIMLSNCDIMNPVSPWHTISVVFRNNDGDLNVLPQGTFDILSMSASIVTTDSDIAYYAFSGQVTIGANSITIPALEYTESLDGTGTKYKGSNFSFSGSFTKLANY